MEKHGWICWQNLAVMRSCMIWSELTSGWCLCSSYDKSVILPSNVEDQRTTYSPTLSPVEMVIHFLSTFCSEGGGVREVVSTGLGWRVWWWTILCSHTCCCGTNSWLTAYYGTIGSITSLEQSWLATKSGIDVLPHLSFSPSSTENVAPLILYIAQGWSVAAYRQ